MLSKITVIQKKILVGGENLLEKAKQQQFLLEASGAELESLEESRQQLEETLHKKGVIILITIYLGPIVIGLFHRQNELT